MSVGKFGENDVTAPVPTRGPTNGDRLRATIDRLHRALERWSARLGIWTWLFVLAALFGG